MADEPSKTPGTLMETPSPQIIPWRRSMTCPACLSRNSRTKSYGGLVSSIQASGVKEPIILRLREDGEYQLVTGYRRRRGSEAGQETGHPGLCV